MNPDYCRCAAARRFLLVLLVSLSGAALPQSLRINEVMSSNSAFLADEDGEFSDWLELYNPGETAVRLADWGLSDKVSNPGKWRFPDLAIQPKSWMLIFADSKDRKAAVPHWETVVRKGQIWRYHLGAASVPAAWIQPGFDDSGWPQGASGIGFGDGDDATTLTASAYSVYGRIAFSIADSAAVLAMVLDMDYDDGFVAWLNGVEIARAGLGPAGTQPAWNLVAADHEAGMYRNLPPERFPIANFSRLLRSGRNILAVEVHNSSTSSTDLSMIPFLSLGYATAPAGSVGSDPRLVLTPTHLHSNFAISASGESVLLSDPSGAVVDSITIPSLAPDISWARIPDGGARWIFCSQPTPEGQNSAAVVAEKAAAVMFSKPAGFYPQPFTITLTCATPGATIRYSRDGSEPDSLSLICSGSLGIGRTTVIRARAFAPGLDPSPITTATYILGQPPAPLPVISLTTDPYNLWDQEYGIYVLGTSYTNEDPYFGANFWEDWERPVHIEFFEPGGALGFSQDAGVKIFGAWSRARPQKSLALFARQSYGNKEFHYRLFPDLPFENYHSFILRNAGNDWDRTFFADALIHSRLKGIDLERQAYRPCTVYLNGDYWGILNMREKINEDYLAQHHNVDPEKIDELEMDGSVIEGTNDHYIVLRDFIASKDLANPQNYAWVQSQMEVDNFITYEAVQIYVDNRDWPGNNIKYWRPQTDEGRWRWILYDTEWGFGINAYASGNAYAYNTLAFATSPTQTPGLHGNPPWSTLLLRRLLLNPDFKAAFINRFADLMNGAYREAPTAAHIDSLEKLLAADMQRHYEKWRQPVPWISSYLWWNSFDQWHEYVRVLRSFALNRPGYMRTHLMQKFGIQKTVTLKLECAPAGVGEVVLNEFLPVRATPWSGTYFSGIPVKLTARPGFGYSFAGWEGDRVSAESTIQVAMAQSMTLKARFVARQDSTAHVVINEINFKSADSYDTEDWVELYNYGLREAAIGGWHLKDDTDDHDFVFPADTRIPGGGFLVASRDTTKFRRFYPQPSIRLFGNLSYGLSSGGDQVCLFDADGVLVDSVAFGITAPWPAAPAGQGPTLELRSPAMDNSLAASWVASTGHGTPGAQNSGYNAVETPHNGPLPTEIELAQNYPNPFNAGTSIAFTLPAPAEVRLEIYSIQGRCIRNLATGRFDVGRHQLVWDGRDDTGSLAASGLYFCRLQSGDFRQVRRMLLLR
ncbi:MAG TPA: CotH kinase family protein [bacterium]|nr:CotH kinase family protein [bacterium]HQG44765.1 CotH kinase family protein [bacterium]HQI47526.1 CotH kinase family protein [bacterium]HQJ63103.1 CotH kinase family protein [bacterium]